MAAFAKGGGARPCTPLILNRPERSGKLLAVDLPAHQVLFSASHLLLLALGQPAQRPHQQLRDNQIAGDVLAHAALHPYRPTALWQ
jgi:hypothetical protein